MNKILPLLAVSFLSAAALADVTVVSEASSTGYRGMGASKTKITRLVSGLKSREEGGTHFTGAVLGLLAGGGEGVHIMRVDLDKRWELDAAKKTYRESPIALPPGKIPPHEDRASRPERDDKPTHRVKSVKVDVKKTGESRAINGFAATRSQATLAVEIEEIATKKTAEYRMMSDVWTTPWTKPLRQAMEEESRFQKAYLKKLGIELAPQDRGRFGLESARMLLSASGSETEAALAKMSRELGKIDGYAVLTETSWHAPATPAGTKAPVQEEEGSALSDASGATSLGGAALGFMGGMAKRAAKKKVAAAVAPKPGAAAFSVRTEVKKIEVKDIPSERFEIPAGYQKKT